MGNIDYKGLTTKEAEERILKYGKNRLPESKKENIIITFLKQFCDPLIYILLFGACISLYLKEYNDGIFILIILSINSLIGTFQEYSAKKSADSLKNMVKSRIIVVRDGDEVEIDSEDITIGDLVILKDGTKVPADIELIEADNLQVNESMLTGESLPVKKDANYIQKENCLIQEKFNEIFAGTIIIKGFAKGVVKNIGSNTEMGKIAEKITQDSEAETPLTQRMEKFSMTFTVIIGIATLIIVIMAILRKEPITETLLMAVSLAVAAIPEGLPITITIALAIGMVKMSKRNVIVRHLSAVESLGSCTVIASDKTGTLTMNELTVQEVIGKNCERYSLKNSIKGILNKIDFNSFDTEKLCYLASVLPNEAGYNEKGYFGDPVDIAFLKYVNSNGYDINEIKNNFPNLKLLMYTSEARCSASFNEINGDVYAFVKGAPETIISMCKQENYSDILGELDKLSNNGYRILAVCYGKVNKKENPNEYNINDLRDLNFLALVSMLDPLKPEVLDAVNTCQNAGIKIAMITGDNPKTAYAIASQLKFVNDFNEVKTGVDIKEAKEKGDSYLDEITKNTKVYSRMEPTQKLDIVQSLIRNGNFVAVTGDGVNDAPALKNANVGVAMGKNGTDIARESADIVLMDDNFASITHAVEEGRITYNNIRKVIFFAVSCGLPKVLIFIIAILLGLPMPFTATQLLWLNVMTEGVQNIFLAFERSEGDEMKRFPRSPSESIFNYVMVKRCIISIIFITLACTISYYYSLKVLNFSKVKASSILLMLFVFIQNIHVLNSRSENKSVFKHSFMQNKKLIFGIIAATSIHIIASYTSIMEKILKIEPLKINEMLVVFLIACGLIFVSEIEKLFRKKD